MDRLRVLVWLGSFSLLVSACGGDTGLGIVPEDFADAGEFEDSDDEDFEAFSSGAGEAGPVSLEADPGQAWAEVDGERIDYGASGAIHYECSIADERLTINFQTGDGNDLLVQGSRSADGWLLNLNFGAADGANITYSAVLPRDGSLGIDEEGLSYEGPVQRVEDFDLANATEVDARVAANCASPGGDPTAVVGGTEYVIPLSGAQSVTCEVTDEMIDVMINRLALDGTQLQMTTQYDGTNWTGVVAVYTAEGNFTSTLTPDVDGPVVDGSAVSFEGTFGSDGGDVEGTVSFTCP